MKTCAGHFHHAGSVDVEAARPASWWPKTTEAARALWTQFTARCDELAAERRRLKQEARAKGEAPPSAEGEKMTAGDRLVMRALLFQFANRKEGRCDPSQAALAEATGLHRTSVARSCRRLLRFGFLTWERRKRVMRRGPVWWMGQASNLYQFIGGAMSQKAAGTQIPILISRGPRLSTFDSWTSRLKFKLRQEQEHEKRRAEVVNRLRRLQPDLF